MSELFDQHSSDAVESEESLLKLVLTLSDKALYSADQTRIVEELTSRRFRFRMVVDQVAKTYVTESTAHSDGQTVDGHLAETGAPVQVQFPPDLESQITALARDDSLTVEAVLHRWLSGLDRLEFWGLTVAPAAAGSPAVETVPSSTAENAPQVPPAVESAVALVPSREELTDNDAPISSWQLIEYLARCCQVSVTQAAMVVDGFWDFLLQPTHYQGGLRTLTLPHFGSFRLGLGELWSTEDSMAAAGQGGACHTRLLFRSRPCKELRARQAERGNRPPDMSWIRRYQAAPSAGQGLSLKRRIAVGIAQDTDLDLDAAFRVLWELIETVTAIMAAQRAPIRWAKRGEMARVAGADGVQYEFRTYERLAKSLPVVPALVERATRSRAAKASGSSGCLLALSTFLLVPGFYLLIGLVRDFLNAH
ncbi:MAG: hypothetical protein VX346_05910 [Planctomycetota bacterium]|nr:hypothetical protein [Planctomycetota bacterium]